MTRDIARPKHIQASSYHQQYRFIKSYLAHVCSLYRMAPCSQELQVFIEITHTLLKVLKLLYICSYAGERCCWVSMWLKQIPVHHMLNFVNTVCFN